MIKFIYDFKKYILMVMHMVCVVGTRGQVTIPKDIRDALKIKPGDSIQFKLDGGTIKITKVKDPISKLEGMGTGIFENGLEVVKRLRKEWKSREERV